MKFSSFACWSVFCAVCVCVCVRVCVALPSRNGVQKKEPLFKTQRLFCLCSSVCVSGKSPLNLFVCV